MIIFQSQFFQLDLTTYGLVFTHENNIFINDSVRNYSLPFSLKLGLLASLNLGLPQVDNIEDYRSEYTGFLIIDGKFYRGTLVLGQTDEDSISCTIFYGDDDLAIYDTKMSLLPWPVIVTDDFLSLANQKLSRYWPEVTHNYPMAFRPEIGEKSDFSFFENFVNHHNGVNFLENTETQVEEDSFTSYTNIQAMLDAQADQVLGEVYKVDDASADPNVSSGRAFYRYRGTLNDTLVDYDRQDETSLFKVYRNRNVMQPWPYLLEMMSFGYKVAGFEVKGSVFDSEKLKRTLYVPETFFSNFKGSQYDRFQFSTPNTNINEDDMALGLYQRIYTPDRLGTFNLNLRFNLDSVTAKHFSLKVFRTDTITNEVTVLYEAVSVDNPVSINKRINLNIDNTTNFEAVRIELKLKANIPSIFDSNSIEYRFEEGRLNEFPNTYSLADFMPDKTFGEFMNVIKNWLNLKTTVKDKTVFIDFVERSLSDMSILDHSQHQDPKHTKFKNTNRLFVLKYKDGQEVLVDSTGQIYSSTRRRNTEVIELQMDVMDVKVQQNYDVVTAVYEEDEEMQFAIYDGLVDGRPLCVDRYDGRGLELQDVYDDHWKRWLSIRTNNKTFKDTSVMHQSEDRDENKKVYKYNEMILVKSYTSTRIDQDNWQVDMEGETI